MGESLAWWRQAVADHGAAERFAGDQSAETRCHAVAKYQQAVEKSVKAIVVSLRDAGTLTIDVGFRHEVARFMKVLIRLPHATDNNSVQQHLRRLLDENARAGILALEALIPRRPKAGAAAQRNTEYPYQDAKGGWTYPAANDVFSSAEVQRFRDLSHRITDGAGRIISAIRRGPK